MPPTRAEIARQLGFRSANAAEEHLKALAKKGVIEILSGTSRGIRLNVPIDDEETEGLPLIGRVAAGEPILATQHVETHYKVDPQLFKPSADYLLRVSGNSMVDIGINPNEDGSNEILNFMRSGSNGFGSIEEASSAISRYLPHRQKPKDYSGLKKNLRLEHDGKYYWHWDPKFIDAISKEQIAYRKRSKNYGNSVRVPTLLIKGALSKVLTQQEVDDFLKTIPHTEFVEIDRAAHMIAGDRNDIFANSAISFLTNLN